MAATGPDKPDDDEPDETLSERLREVAAAREERQRRWSAGEYPQAAYDAVELLAARVPPPKRYAKDWGAHIESVVRDAIDADDARDAESVAAAVEPTLRATKKLIESTQLPSGFDSIFKSTQLPSGFDSIFKSTQLPSGFESIFKSTQLPSGFDSIFKSTQLPSGFDSIFKSTQLPSGFESIFKSTQLPSGFESIFKSTQLPTGFESIFKSVYAQPGFDDVVRAVREDDDLEDVSNALAVELSDAVRAIPDAADPTDLVEQASTNDQAGASSHRLGQREWVFIVAMAEAVRQLALEQPGVTDAQGALIMLAAIWLISTEWARERG